MRNQRRPNGFRGTMEEEGYFKLPKGILRIAEAVFKSDIFSH